MSTLQDKIKEIATLPDYQTEQLTALFKQEMNALVGEMEPVGKHDECYIEQDQGGWVCHDHDGWASDELGVARPERPMRNELRKKLLTKIETL